MEGSATGRGGSTPPAHLRLLTGFDRFRPSSGGVHTPRPVSGLTYFASETGCELIAEGVETPEELAALRDLGIRLGQGYLLGHPKPAPTSAD